MTDLLTDPTGSRRFLSAEVDDKIDCTPVSYTHLDVYKRQAMHIWMVN